MYDISLCEIIHSNKVMFGLVLAESKRVGSTSRSPTALASDRAYSCLRDCWRRNRWRLFAQSLSACSSNPAPSRIRPEHYTNIVCTTCPLWDSSRCKILETRKYLLLKISGFYRPEENFFNFIKCMFVLLIRCVTSRVCTLHWAVSY